jgi:thioredoxin 1
LLEITTEREFRDAVASDGKVVVLFTAPSWCVPCQRFEPFWNRAVEVASEITFARVDIDDNPWTQAHGIRSVPTCHLYEDGQFARNIKVPQAAIPFIADVRY